MRRLGIVLIWTAASFSVVTTPVLSQGAVIEKAQLQAALMHGLLQEITWPEGELGAPNEPFRIAVLAPSGVAKILEHYISSRPIHGHPVEVVMFDGFPESDGDVAQVQACHALFVSRHYPDRKAADLLGQLGDAVVLAIGESGGLLDHGGAIRLSQRGGRIVPVANFDNLRASGFTASQRFIDLVGAQ